MNTVSKPKRLELPKAPHEYSALINGNFIPASGRETITRENPAHLVPVSIYPKATTEDLQEAIKSARRAADARVWSAMSGAERSKILLRVAELIDKHRVELGSIECLEVGKPISLVDREIGGSIAHWEYAATLARHTYGDTYDSLGNDALGLLFREPIGVVSMITPWNYPLLIVSQKLPFALAVGCSAIVKPSELTSGTTLRLGELLMEAGIPEGVVNILAGTGPDLGEGLCASPEIDMISFTGSTRVGRLIGRIAGENLKRVSLELGGKGAHIVCADADLAAAAEKVALGVTRNAGQACVSGSRLVVQSSVAAEFLDAVVTEIGKLNIGDPLEPDTTMGPLVSSIQKDRVDGYVASGDEAGARRYWTMSAKPDSPARGYFVQPTVFTDVDPRMKIAQEEIFGPVLSTIEFDTVEEAVGIANSTPYGLAAGVWTNDVNKAFQFVRNLKVGTVEVNTFLAGTPELPLAGHGDSGVGTERGRFAVDEFTELKTVNLQLHGVS